MQEQDNLSLDSCTESSAHADELRETAERIRERDRRLYEGARSYWLQTAYDLIRAKELLRHGRFEAWCASELTYSKSKAEKLMRTAEVFGPLLKSVTVTDLPQPAALYALSAPSVPQEIRDRFIPCIIAGQKVGSEVREAIRQHREKVEREKHLAALSPEAKLDHERREAQRAKREARKKAQSQAERERQVVARSAALTLIVTRLGNALLELLALVAEAAPGSVFEPAAERELQQQVTTAVPASVTAGREADDPAAVSTDGAAGSESEELGNRDTGSELPGVTERQQDQVVSTFGGVLGPFNEWKERRRSKTAQVRASAPSALSESVELTVSRER